MPLFKKSKSSTSKELESKLQELLQRVEALEKEQKDLKRQLQQISQGTSHGRITELKKCSEEKQELKNQVADNKSGLPDSPPEMVNGNDSVMDGHHQVDTVEDCEVTVHVNRENIKEVEDELEQTVKNDSVEKTAHTCVEGVNGQKDKLEQICEAECMEETVIGCVEGVNGQDKHEQIGPAECAEETVLVHKEGFQSEDSGMEAVRQSHQVMYNRRILCIVICVLLCAVGLLIWGVYGWGVDECDCTTPVSNVPEGEWLHIVLEFSI